jgi:radical SAM superfamily enzyme YgiQ (UPF0313 family)
MAVKRIALVNPNRWKPKTAPVALDYLSSSLESRGFRVDLLDLCHAADVKQTVKTFFRDHPADLVGVTLRNLDDIHYGRFMVPELRDIMRHVKDAANAPIVLGGSGFSICPERVLEYCGLDMGIAGEGEFALPMLASDLSDRSDLADIPGLVYRDGDGFRRNPVGTNDLAGMCLSGRSKVDYSRYISKGGAKGGTGVQTKRGCTQDCIYCIVPAVEGRVMRLRPVPDIVDEIENLIAKGVKRFFFADSEFNYPEEHAKMICREMIDRKLADKMRWSVYTAPKPFSLELAKLMVEAGCRLAIFTIENANEKVLKCMRKDFTPDDVRQMARACKEAGLTFSYCTMFGGPGETMNTVLETLDLMKEVRAQGVTMWDPPGMRIYPNTPLADIVREEGFSRKNPNLHGRIKGNDDFFEPVYYLSAQMGILATGIKAWRKVGLIRQGISALRA